MSYALAAGVLLAYGGCMSSWLTLSLTRGGHELVFNDPQLTPTPVGADGIPFFERRPLFDAIPGKIGSHAATITAFADGELLAAWYSYDGPEELDGSAIYMSRRTADQTQWSEPAVLIDRPEGDGNPVLYSEQNRVWLFQAVAPNGWATSHIEIQTSQDRGNTWLEPKRLCSPLGWNVRHPPVRTAEGTLLLPAYTELLPRSVFYTSENGEDWNLLGAVWTTPENIQPSIARLPNGRLLAVMRNSGGGWLWVMESNDSGHTWSHPTDSGFDNPGSAACVLTLASGNLLLVFNDSPDRRSPLSVAISADGGRTWPVRKEIAYGDGTYSYPSAVQSPNGLVHVVYSLGRERIEHVAFNEAWLADPAAVAP